MKPMKTIFTALLVATFFIAPGSVSKTDLEREADRQQAQLTELFELRPIDTKPLVETERFKLGRALFFDKLLSGNHDVACATCHLASWNKRRKTYFTWRPWRPRA